jgi:hypothetical protein
MRTLILALPLLAALPLVARADDKSSDFLKPDNWEGLMDHWKIDGTTVYGTSTKDGLKFNTFLCSKKKYGDFEMKFQIKLGGGADANSGIQIRSRIHDMKKFAVTGPQADIGEGYWGSLYGENFGGMMKMADKNAVNAKLKKGDFNDYTIKCVGKHCTITVNGVTTVDDDFEKMPAEGIIAFQLHVTKTPMEVTFKNIEFKELTK